MDLAKEKKGYIDYSFSWKGLRADFVVKCIHCEIINAALHQNTSLVIQSRVYFLSYQVGNAEDRFS